MQTRKIARAIICLVLTALGACDELDKQETVTASNLWCNVAGTGSRALEMVTLECVVAVGGTTVTKEGIQVSVRSVLSVNVLPEVCPSYTRAELDASMQEFSTDVRTELAASYVAAGANWDIDSVRCAIAN